jgi:hypothetical protein
MQLFWLSRLQMQTAVYDAPGTRQELLTLLETQPTDTVELAVALGKRQRLAARLLAVRVPQDVADTRQRRLWQAARDKGCQVSFSARRARRDLPCSVARAATL